MAEKVWVVNTGRPSWHQQRAGHISAGGIVWHSKEEAEQYMSRYKQHHPDEPAFITEETRD